MATADEYLNSIQVQLASLHNITSTQLIPFTDDLMNIDEMVSDLVDEIKESV